MQEQVRNRDWVKNAAIIFLVVLLVLTFFSNTIMNRSLPEVATQEVESGSIVARVRGTGTVQANSNTQVKMDRTRVIRSVLVKVGQQVEAGDVLFTLGEGASEEIDAAEEKLQSLQASYNRTAATIPDFSYGADQNRLGHLEEAYREAVVAEQAALKAAQQAAPNSTQLEEAKRELAAALNDLETVKKEYDDQLTQASQAESNQIEKLVKEAKQQEIVIRLVRDNYIDADLVMDLTTYTDRERIVLQIDRINKGTSEAKQIKQSNSENTTSSTPATNNATNLTTQTNQDLATSVTSAQQQSELLEQKMAELNAAKEEAAQKANELGLATPAANTPEVTTPAANTPEVTTPAASTPEITAPAASTPEITAPAASTPEVTAPAASTPEVTTPEVTTLEVTTPEVTTPEVTTPEVTTPEVTTPDGTTPEQGEGTNQLASKSYNNQTSALTLLFGNSASSIKSPKTGDESGIDERIREAKEDADKAYEKMKTESTTSLDLLQKCLEYYDNIQREIYVAYVNYGALEIARSAYDAAVLAVEKWRTAVEVLSASGNTPQSEAYKEAKQNRIYAEESYLQAKQSLREKISSNENTLAGYNADLANLWQQIVRAREKLDDLLGGEEAQIKARVSGTIQTLDASPGDTKKKDDVIATIEAPDMGYTLSFSVTNDQANRLRVGDTATVSNFYWGSEITATLTSIKIDQKNPQTNKILTFDLSGNVTSGTELTLSVGQKSANYDVIIPSSSVRTDANGTYVLKLESKNSPLGNRYLARRVPVEVLAVDDTNTAVSAELGYGDYVITSSSSPLKNGELVRLATSA